MIKPLLVPLGGTMCEECGYSAAGMIVFPKGKIIRHRDPRVGEHRIGIIPPMPTAEEGPTPATEPVLAKTA